MSKSYLHLHASVLLQGCTQHRNHDSQLQCIEEEEIDFLQFLWYGHNQRPHRGCGLVDQ